MPLFNPQLILVMSFVFFTLGIFSFFLGRKRRQQLREQGIFTPWYKQVSLLTSLEYILLAIVLLLNRGMSSGFIPVSLGGLIIPFYVLVLGLAAVVMMAMIYWGLRGTRQTQPATVTTNETSATDETTMTPEQRLQIEQRRRERKQKAAQARKRRTGRA